MNRRKELVTVRRLSARILMLLVCAASALVAAPLPASADTPSLVRNHATQQCLHHNGNGRITTVVNCSRTNGAQLWHVHRSEFGEPWRRVVSSHGGLCLDSNLPGSDGRGDVYARPCEKGNTFQAWRWLPNADGNRVQHRVSDLCLDADSSGRVYTLQCNSGLFQRWQRQR
ncbi:RICIN domain-containing protein [Streptomyces sp. WMMC500]|uniref:RICIN domain-containing protein n=1 Tax=Streptomyces sp. WMMC500 TaxID=3015154 RepID=UPI00248BF3EF|nr:RICIN domain-containing protein [Streptomyces sp. WMMC500]WBB59703.1 RICIN domain-containing protein [Streptomyces sp. WMMC500]